MNRYLVTVIETHVVEVVAENRDGAALSALGEVNRQPGDLTHDGTLHTSQQSVTSVLQEFVGPDQRMTLRLPA